MMGEEEFGRYCDDVENTVEWGGQPEVRAAWFRTRNDGADSL